jgi:hypothetical protein
MTNCNQVTSLTTFPKMTAVSGGLAAGFGPDYPEWVGVEGERLETRVEGSPGTDSAAEKNRAAVLHLLGPRYFWGGVVCRL